MSTRGNDTVRWVKFGDEDAKLFHVATTKRYMINTITQIEGDDGRILTDHNEKPETLL